MGGEEAFLAPEDVISRDDASDAVRRAIKVYGLWSIQEIYDKNRERRIKSFILIINLSITVDASDQCCYKAFDM